MLGNVGAAVLAMVLVTLCSLCGPLLLPLLRSRSAWGQLFMSFMISLGAGVLVGDALLHLLPRAYGVDDAVVAAANGANATHTAMGGGSGGTAAPPQPEVRAFNVGLMAFFGMYLLYCAEKNAFALLGQRHSHSHSHTHGRREQSSSGDDGDGNDYFDEDEDDDAAEEQIALDGDEDRDPLSPTPPTPPTMTAAPRPRPKRRTRAASPKSVGWVILIGDALHNIVDGLAIGASFASDPALGWTTTVVILFHEIPHEAGDFAVLIRSGFTVARALLFTGLSQLTAFVGLAVGLALGVHPGAEALLLALTAGMFLYIALVDLIPEMGAKDGVNESATMLVVRNVGLLLGVGVMAVVAQLDMALGAH